MNYKKNCMSYWFPKLVKTGVPFPDTLMIDMNKVDKNFIEGMQTIFWMKKPTKKHMIAFTRFRQVLEKMGRRIGYPFFLRTGQTSHKHEWYTTCFIQNKAILMKHAQNIAEHSIMANMEGGLPINIWVARKLIEVEPIFETFSGQMPITKEFRYFIRDGKIECRHPYWLEEAIDGHTQDKDWKLKLKRISQLSYLEAKYLDRLTNQVASNFKGYWSLDWLKSRDGKWYAIDMATGEDSYHYPNCKKEAKMGKGRGNKPKREKRKPKKKKK